MVEEEAAVRYRGALVLLILAAGLGAFYYFVVLPRATHQRLIDEISQKYFRSDTSSLEFIRIRNSNGTFDLAKKAEGWALVAPRSMDADAETVRDILGLIQTGKILKILSTDTSRLAEFGLDRPAVVLSFGFSGKIDEIAFGNENPARTGAYAYAKGVRAVFLVDSKILKQLSVGLFDLRDKTVFHFDPEDIVSIAITSSKGVIDMKKESRQWRMIKPLMEKASPAAVKSFLDGLAGQRAEEVYDGPSPGGGAFIKTVRIDLTARDGQKRRLRVDYQGTGAREGVSAYQAGMDHSARLQREFWDFVDRNASSFVSRNMLPVDEGNIGGIEVTRGASHYRLERKRTGWFIGGRPALENKVIPFIWFLKDWNAVQLIGPDPDLERNAPEIVVTLEDRSGAGMGRVAVYGKVGAAAGYLGSEQVDNLYARSQAVRGACLVSSADLKKIPSKEELVQ